MNQRIVLVGAGSAQFGYGMLGDIMQSEALQDSVVVLHDINPKTISVVATTAAEFIAKEKLPFTIESTTDRVEALRGADFVIVSIEVGDRFELWDQDRTIPQQYGITQIYGENGGPGGVFHALRIIPPILEICDDIAKICPEAMVFCYSNPMTAICTTVNRKYPKMNFFGMCHEIASLPRYLPEILGTSYDNLDVVAGGLNHFSAVLEARYRDSGKDAYPDIRTMAPAFFEKEPGYSDIWREIQKNPETVHSEGSERRAKLKTLHSEKPWADRGLFRVILEEFGVLPITSDSHFGEYIGWAHNVADHKGILDFYALYRNSLSDVNPSIKLSLSERVVPMIDGFLTGSEYVEAAVNVPNNGLIAELPEFVAVEVPCDVTKEGIRGKQMPPLPKAYAALLRNYTGVYDLTAEAILNKSKRLVVQAMLVNPIVHKVDGLHEMVDVMISLQSKWLGYLS